MQTLITPSSSSSFFFFFFFFFFFACSTTFISFSHGLPDAMAIGEWCNDTPHPKACEYYLTHTSPSYTTPKDMPGFYRLSLQAALVRAQRAHRRLLKLKSQCHTPQEWHAWSDCVKLYTNTVLQLNRTFHPPGGATTAKPSRYYDYQTWLSAALTNLDMCSKGFDALNASTGIISPLLKRYNVSDLVSNCLAINTPMVKATEVKKGGGMFPAVGTRRGLQAAAVKANLVVAKDGSGNYKSIAAAVAAAGRMRRSGRLVIYVKAGVYRENVQITSSQTDITLVGSGKGKTVITNNKSVKGGYTLITCATLAVFGDGFIARDLSIRNTYGPGSQALALLLASDRSVVYRTNIEGYQDTLCVFSQRQFFRETAIYGTIDFIFGNAAVVFQRCTIVARRPRLGESNVVTAQGRSDPNQNTGIVIQSSIIKAGSDLRPSLKSFKTFLGRPWQQYSRTVVMQSYIEGLVDPEGWLAWNSVPALSTLYYAEYRNTGAGARMSGRVKWPGFHIVVKPSVVSKFTVANFIAGDMWIPATGMPFSAGL